MVRVRLVAPLLVLALAACASEPPKQTMPAQDMSAMGMPQPGPEHKLLLDSVGTWEGTMTMFMPDVPSTPVAAKEVVSALGPFWTTSKFTCNFMGMAFEGTGTMGYDQREKQYVGTWIDNMTTHLAVMSGDMGADGKTMVMRWQAPDPATGKLTPERNETVFAKDSYTSTFYLGEGAGTKIMVIAMKRTAGGAK